MKMVWISLLLLVQVLSASQNHTLLCVTDTNSTAHTLCTQKSQRLFISPQTSIHKALFRIQSHLRKRIDKDTQRYYFLYAKGFTGLLTTIAQGNLHPYYRQNIKGLILEDTPALLSKACKKDANLSKKIRAWHTVFKKNGSLYEVKNALSPALQMDWYSPDTLLIESELSSAQKTAWQKAFQRNHIRFNTLKSFDLSTIHTFIKTTPLTSMTHTKAPPYYGPLLRFHLGKVITPSKGEITVWHDLRYGSAPQQSYDVYFSPKQTNNPMLIYVHGGGWSKGDKQAYASLCKQYANRGYTCISLNYRLLKLPKIGMKEMIKDVKNGILQSMKKASKYQADNTRVAVMGESAGAHLLFMALTQIKDKRIKVAILNSITSNLAKHPIKKQQRLSGIMDKKARAIWLKQYSPYLHLKSYSTPTLLIHSLQDRVVPSLHSKVVEVQSVIAHNNISSYWVIDAGHPVAPTSKSMQTNYQDIETKIDGFLEKHLGKVHTYP